MARHKVIQGAESRKQMAGNWRKTWYCLLLLGPFFLFSCSDGEQGAVNVFRYNQPEGLATLDPAFAKSQPVMWATNQIYNSLVEIDESLRIRPSLASRWEIRDDGRTYIFTLRKDIFFHDNQAFPDGKGRRMVAADVVYSLGRIIDKAVASPGAWIFNGRVDSIAPFSAPDDSTVVVRLLKPFPPILGILSMKYCSVVPKEVVDRYGKDFRRNPCGTGPFMMKYWEEGQALVLHRNPRYFELDGSGRKLPYMEAVKISFLDNKATEFMEFRQGRLDFVNDIEASFKDEVLTKKGELKESWKGRVVMNKYPYLNTEYLGILVDSSSPDMRESPLRLRKIRQAMNHAIDRRKMMMYLRNSIGIPAESGFVPAGLPSFDPSRVRGYPYDPRKARTLLKEAGYRPDIRIALKTVPVYAELGAFVARQLEDVGMNVQVETVQRATLLEEIAKSTAPFFRASWIADYPDAENYLSVFYGKNPAPPNYTRYRNPEYDRLYELALTETNDSLRYELYRRMDQMIMDDAPIIPLWYDMVIHLVNPQVTGFKPNALNLLDLRRAGKRM